MSITLRKLTYLVTASRLGKFSAAAEQLRVSQPALSRSIAELESHYGLKLFDRSRNGVTTTAVGDQIVSEAECILKGVENFERKYKLIGKGEVGHVSLGIGSTIAGILLPDLGGFILSKYQSAEITTLIRPAGVLIEALLENSIDLFVAPIDGRLFPDEIEVSEIGQISLEVVARAGHPVFSLRIPGLQDLAAYPIASAVEVPWLKHINPDAGQFICDNYSILINIMLKSNYIVICPRSAVESDLIDGSAKLIDVEIPISRKMTIIFGRLKSRTPSPTVKQIIDYLKEWRDCGESLLRAVFDRSES